MSKLDWSQFTRRIFINASQEVVYSAWADPIEIEKWFFEKANYTDKDGNARASLIQAGDSYSWKWHNWDFIQTGEILAANGQDNLAFTFGQKAGKVKIQIEGISNDQSQVVLTQYDIDTDEQSKMSYFNGCSLGWSFWLVNLKAWLEHGILLNETQNPLNLGALINQQVNT